MTLMANAKSKMLSSILNLKCLHACQAYAYAPCQTNALFVQDMAGNWDRPRSADNLNGITGTVLWAPLSVLEGEQHSVSSMLEGLFISALSLSCNGKLDLRHDMNPEHLRRCAFLRRGHLTTPVLFELPRIESHLKPLIFGLHNLFYPPCNKEGIKSRVYNTQFTVELVQGVCEKVCGALSP